MSLRVAQIGTIPHPVGGVSNHVWRLCRQLQTPCTLFDLHPEKLKYGLPGVIQFSAPHSRPLRPLWLLWHLARRGGDFELIHFHLSTLDKLVAALPALLMRRGKARLVLTLHHGDQEAVYARLSGPLQSLAAKALRQFDGIVSLTPAHRTLFERLGVPSARILEISSNYIRPPKGLANPQAPIPGLADLQARKTFIAVASGFATEIYQHEQAIEAVDRLRETQEAHLFICLYGSISKGYLQRLEAMVSERKHIRLLWGLELPAFLELLSAADVYLRPTAVDSFGIAVADAIQQGTPVIASDVCPRYPGAITYPSGDTQRFQAALMDLAHRADGPLSLPAELPADAASELVQWYDRLCGSIMTV